MIFACDLDNTLIFSGSKIKPPFVCVEYKDGKELSFMTEYAWNTLKTVQLELNFVPLTTRSLEQFRRICFPGGMPQYALVSNGALLLNKGEIDALWCEKSIESTSYAESELKKAERLLKSDPDVYFEIRMVDSFFLFTKSRNIQKSSQRLLELLDPELVIIDSMGEKLYVLPSFLTKGQALKRLKKKLNERSALAAGDSLFDLSMLLEADKALIPSKKELVECLSTHCAILKYPKDDCFYSEWVLKTAYSWIQNHNLG